MPDLRCVCASVYVCVLIALYIYKNFTVEQKTNSSIENCCKQCKNIGFIFRQNPKLKQQQKNPAYVIRQFVKR